MFCSTNTKGVVEGGSIKKKLTDKEIKAVLEVAIVRSKEYGFSSVSSRLFAMEGLSDGEKELIATALYREYYQPTLH